MSVLTTNAGEAVLRLEIEEEDDGRWIGEASDLPGVLAYGVTRQEAETRTLALALRVIADRIEHGEPLPFDARSLLVGA